MDHSTALALIILGIGSLTTAGTYLAYWLRHRRDEKGQPEGEPRLL